MRSTVHIGNSIGMEIKSFVVDIIRMIRKKILEELDSTCTVTASEGKALKVKDRKFTALCEEGIDGEERLTVRVLQQVVLIA